ncbi:MAG: hypothetical protein JWM87_3441 [Candidatus Eremiobacteraeota bacterium]|nr:hypothetical protein [Candidatus Eremiobacteraeota bacterium]
MRGVIETADAVLAGAARSFDPQSVIVALAGDDYAGAARALAAATGRRALEAERFDSALFDGAAPRTLVARPERFGADVLGGLDPAARTGVLTARSLAVLERLIARILAHAGDRTAELAVMRGHGRECCVHTAGGTLCGRSGDARPGAGRGVTASCQLGRGCYRDGADPAAVPRIASIPADVILTDLCGGFDLSGALLDSSLSLALSAVEGSAIAYVGSTWTKMGAPYAEPLLGALLRGGAALGDAVAELNRAERADGLGFGAFTLLGDAGLRLHPPAPIAPPLRIASGASAAVRYDVLERLELDPGVAFEQLAFEPGGDLAPLAVPRGGGAWYLVPRAGAAARGMLRVRERSPLRELSAAVAEPLGRLAALEAFEIVPLKARLDQIKRGADRVGRTFTRRRTPLDDASLENDVSRLVEQVLDLQHGICDELIERTAQSEYYFGPEAIVRFDVVAERRMRCTQCGCSTARRFDFAHRVWPAYRMNVHTCPRCKFVAQGTNAGWSGRIAGPDTMRAGDRFHQEIVIVNEHTRPLEASLGFAWLNGSSHGVDAAPARRAVVAPSDALHVTFEGATSARETLPDLHIVRAVAVANGELLLLQKRIGVVL